MNPFAFKLRSYGVSDIGLVRNNNEDVFLSLTKFGFFAVADGMGGHNAGEVAAKEAIHFVSTSIEELFLSSEKKWNLSELSSFSRLCLENANSWIHYLGKKKESCQGMGTTLCTLLFHDRSLIYGHVGDSRIYRLRNGKLNQLTLDHSLKNDLIAQGQFSENHSREFPLKNILTRAIGTQSDVEAEIHIAPVMANDLYLMCTDGLTDQVSDREIAETLQKYPDLEEAATCLIEKTKKMGGHDNVTIVVVKTEEDEAFSR